MLCQRCTRLLKATNSPMLPAQAARRALSTSSRLPKPQALLRQARPQPRPQLRTLPTPSAPLPISSQLFHTSTLRSRPADSPAAPDPPAAAAPSAPEKPDFLNEAESGIWDLLVKEFSPVELVVQDISGGCGSMYGIEIASEQFRGANMLKQQRMVNAVLGDLLKGWHGCQLKTRVP